MDFLEAIRNPVHEEHVAMWRWCGGPFDPGGFDINAANAAIRNVAARSITRTVKMTSPDAYMRPPVSVADLSR